nr:alpha/beta hydrolase [Sinorhizobium mexicanum]
MSVAFVKEESAETAAETLLPDRPISPHPNLVTEAGLKALEMQLRQAREAYDATSVIEDVNERRRQAASPYGLLPRIGALHLTVYSSPNDQALAISSGLFGSVVRLGRLTSASIDSKEAGSSALWKNSQMSGIADFIEYKGISGFAGHSYFLSDPAVQKDLAALIRDGLKAGDRGRPLVEIKRPFWSILSRTAMHSR